MVIALVSGEVDEKKLRAKIIGLNVPLIPKPVALGELRNWAACVMAQSPSARFEQELARQERAHGLTTREVEVVRAARLRSGENKATAAELGIGLRIERRFQGKPSQVVRHQHSPMHIVADRMRQFVQQLVGHRQHPAIGRHAQSTHVMRLEIANHQKLSICRVEDS